MSCKWAINTNGFDLRGVWVNTVSGFNANGFGLSHAHFFKLV
jgi:hypothetical protein